MSDTHVRGRLQGLPAQHQAQDYEDAEDDEGSIEDCLLTVEHVVYDQSIQIKQLEECMIECMIAGFTELQNLSMGQ